MKQRRHHGYTKSAMMDDDQTVEQILNSDSCKEGFENMVEQDEIKKDKKLTAYEKALKIIEPRV
jgi:hypothetical protein